MSIPLLCVELEKVTPGCYPTVAVDHVTVFVKNKRIDLPPVGILKMLAQTRFVSHREQQLVLFLLSVKELRIAAEKILAHTGVFRQEFCLNGARRPLERRYFGRSIETVKIGSACMRPWNSKRCVSPLPRGCWSRRLNSSILPGRDQPKRLAPDGPGVARSGAEPEVACCCSGMLCSLDIYVRRSGFEGVHKKRQCDDLPEDGQLTDEAVALGYVVTKRAGYKGRWQDKHSRRNHHIQV